MLFLRKIMSAWLALALCGAPQLLRAQQTGNETQSAQPSPATNAPAPQQAAPPPAANEPQPPANAEPQRQQPQAQSPNPQTQGTTVDPTQGPLQPAETQSAEPEQNQEQPAANQPAQRPQAQTTCPLYSIPRQHVTCSSTSSRRAPTILSWRRSACRRDGWLTRSLNLCWPPSGSRFRPPDEATPAKGSAEPTRCFRRGR